MHAFFSGLELAVQNESKQKRQVDEMKEWRHIAGALGSLNLQLLGTSDSLDAFYVFFIT